MQGLSGRVGRHPQMPCIPMLSSSLIQKQPGIFVVTVVCAYSKA